MEEKDRHVEPDEGHKGRNINKDEGDDVEAHSNIGSVNLGEPAVNREDEGDDDVEAHVNLNAPQKD